MGIEWDNAGILVEHEIILSVIKIRIKRLYSKAVGLIVFVSPLTPEVEIFLRCAT